MNAITPTQPTPGPWKAIFRMVKRRNFDRDFGGETREGLRISINGKDGLGVATIGLLNTRPDEEAKLNGHLIAAAPDLLGALKAMLAIQKDVLPADPIEAEALAEAAIAKAEGRA